MPTEVDAQAVINRLLRRIARLEYELAVAQEAAAQATQPAAEPDEGDD